MTSITCRSTTYKLKLKMILIPTSTFSDNTQITHLDVVAATNQDG